MKIFLKKYWHILLLGFGIVGYSIVLSAISIHRMWHLDSYYYDLGIMNQVVFNTSRGHFLEMTNQLYRANISRFAIHVDPILALFAPLYWIYSGPQTILIIQSIVLALGAIPVYLLAVTKIKSKLWGIIFAYSYLLYFPVARQNTFDVHGVVFATSFVLFMIYFAEVKKFRWSFVFAILSLLTKEHVGLVIALFGVYHGLARKARKFGFILFLLGVIFFITSVFVIIPTARAADSFYLRYFNNFGDSTGGVLSGILKNPHIVIGYFFDTARTNFFARLLLPYFPFVFFAPWILIIPGPELLINILSANSNLRSIYFQYNALIIPFIIFASIEGFAIFHKKWMKSKIIFGGFVLVFAMSFYQSATTYSPLPFSNFKNAYKFAPIDGAKHTIISTWQDKLSDEGIVVASTPRLAPFFTSRRTYFNFLLDSEFDKMGISHDDIIKDIDKYTRADYVIIYKAEVDPKRPYASEYYNHLKANPEFEKIYDADEIEVYKKQI